MTEPTIAAGLFIVSIVNIMIAGKFWRFWRRDATDGPYERSGLMIFTDHGTGVEYVGSPLLGMCVRVDRDGKPMIAEAHRP